MKIKELIEELTKLNPELDVVVSSDDEGNSFRKLWGITPGIIVEDSYYVEFTTWAVDEDGEEIYPGVEVAIEEATAVCLG